MDRLPWTQRWSRLLLYTLVQVASLFRTLRLPILPLTRILVLAFSTLVLCSGLSCFLLEKDWFKTIPPKAKVPMYMALGVSLCFSITFTCVDLLNAYHDRHSYDMRRRALVQTPQQVGVVRTTRAGADHTRGSD